MTTSTTTVPATDDAAAFRNANVRPLWEIQQAHSDAKPEHRATLWPWRTMKPLVDRACALTSPAAAERRVLSFIAPDAKPGDFHTITNLNGGLQIILPGEVARPHRHSMDALRFVLDGEGAVTRVDGKVAPMQRGDLVLTPGWCWHEHWHEGTAPIVWLDVLNVHTHINLQTFSFEPGPPHDVPELPSDDAFAFANCVPDVAATPFSPVFRYPLASVTAALDAAAPSADGARRVRYINPLTGGPVMSLLDCWMLRLDPGVTTTPFRTSAHAIATVVSGSGTTTVGRDTIAWESRDVFTLPHDTGVSHHADEVSYLFVVSDREIYRRLDLLTETYDAPGKGNCVMQFGVQFFPDVKPAEKSAADYFRDSLEIAVASEALGFTHVRIVEHYFHYYGGYSPAPMLFLAAVAARTKTTRLVTGAVLPVFNHPFKLAGEIAMLDAISNGRMDVGFARAFLPHEFRRFGISPDESVARFREGLEQVDLLLREENVTHHGRFHTIDATTSLPRPTQLPRPKFYIALSGTLDSFVFAGKQGHAIMCIPMAAEKLSECLAAYRAAWKDAGHPGNGEVMMAFSMFVDEDGDRARRLAGPRIKAYLDSLIEAASDWDGALDSPDYPGYDRMVQSLRAQTMETQIASGSAWVGTPAEVRATIARMQAAYGGFDHASMQINFNLMPQDEAMRSMRLFAEEVIPAFTSAPVAIAS